MLALSGYIGGYCLVEGYSVPEAIIGGYCSTKPTSEGQDAAILGGYSKVEAIDVNGEVGGFCLTLEFIDPSGEFGGYSLVKMQPDDGIVGGYMISYPDCIQFVEAHARTLVKARSKDVVDQDLNIDCSVVFKGRSNKDFNAKFIWFASANADFNARVKVEKYKRPPLVEILSVTPASGVLINGCRKVTVIASGTLLDGDEWVNAYIDFGEPFQSTNPRIFTTNMSVSGFSGPPPWTAFHDYCVSGRYVVTARGQDNLGMVGMDAYGLNLAVGLSNDIFPSISISGQPRSGEVPDAVKVDFSVNSSGIAVPPATTKQSSSSKIGSPSDRRILWSFGNRETSQKTNPFTYYQSPGLYAVALRYLYNHPSGHNLWVSDTLMVGYNR